MNTNISPQVGKDQGNRNSATVDRELFKLVKLFAVKHDVRYGTALDRIVEAGLVSVGLRSATGEKQTN